MHSCRNRAPRCVRGYFFMFIYTAVHSIGLLGFFCNRRKQKKGLI